MEKGEDIFLINKSVGQTPLEAVNQLKEKKPELKDRKMTYAGRLDPMAQGLLLVLSGQELKKQSYYWKLSKDYAADILLGVSSDSGDVLGILKSHDLPELSGKDIEKAVKSLEGKIRISLPAFSSYRVEGKPLFWWATKGRLDEVEIPDRQVEVQKAELLDFKLVSWQELAKEAVFKIDSVTGKFRQKEARDSWLDFDPQKEKYPVLKVSISCSSGTYIRSLAEKLGSFLGTGGLVFNLVRTRIGDFVLKDRMVQ